MEPVTRTGHSASAEEESLKLVGELIAELTHALNSLGGKKPKTLLDKYRFWSSKHLHRVVGGFALLRRSAYVDSSKLLIRPAIEMLIRLEAAAKDPDLFYRIAYSEHLEDEKLLRAADKLLKDDPQKSEQRWKTFEENWQRFRAAFTTEFPEADRWTKSYLWPARLKK